MKEQNLIQGWNSTREIGTVLSKGQFKKVLLVTGKRSFELSPRKDVLLGALSSTQYRIFNDFRVNPKYDAVLKGINIFRELNPDVIIAIGGGTVLDMAKLISALAVVPLDADLYITGDRKLTGTAVPLAAVPTTSGTGSEATHFAVVYLHGKKYSLAHPSILPDYVILDPGLTMNMPPFLTACTGMDALCQAVESYWSVNSTEESLAFSRKGVEMAVQNIKKAVFDPDGNSREAMQQAAYYAGRGINLAKTTAAHAFSYYLTSEYGIPHGQAVGLLMGWVFRNNLGVNERNCRDPRGPLFVKDRLAELSEMIGIHGPEDAEQFFTSLMNELSLNTKNFVLNNRSKAKLFTVVNKERLKNNPVEIASV
jgi:alcohol dehydrogenase